MGVDYTEVFQLLREQADEDIAREMSAYMRDLFPFLGVKTPVRRKLSRQFLKEAKREPGIDWEFIARCWELEREFQYLALDYLQSVAALLTPEDIPQLRKLVLSKSWWDTIDSLDSIIGDIALRYPEVNAIMLAWSTEDDFWLRRIAIDHQIGRKDKTDTALLEKIIVNNLGQTEFFINKAIGWSLREYSKTDPSWVSDFVTRHQEKLAPLSIREASKYLNT